jgi:hypothetical protein
MLAMTISQSLRLALTASVLAFSWVMPASATELPVSATHKVANLVTPAKKPAQHGFVRTTTEALPPSADNRPRWPFGVIVLGVAY